MARQSKRSQKPRRRFAEEFKSEALALADKVGVSGAAEQLVVQRELLVEVAFNEAQESPQYPAGLALRFVRVKLHRPDKSPVDCDTIKTVKAIFQRKIGVA